MEGSLRIVPSIHIREVLMKLHDLEKLQRQCAVVAGRYIIGIDPAKAKHEAQILDPGGLPAGSSFSFTGTSEGIRRQLWR